MIFFLKLVLGIISALVLFGILRTWQIEHDANQTLFAGGIVPNPMPDGLYVGSVPGHTVSWLGKRFNSASSTGINVFDTGNGNTADRYSFKTSVGKGLRDKDLEILQIDYNISDNPFWLRPILDEIVQVAPNQYLGKLQVRLIPGFPFTLSYFELKK